jgi:hypothetical protein
MKQAAIALIVALCLYLFGHHKGWAERDAEMQAEIAQKNEESRAKELELQEKLNSQTTQLLDANNVITQKQSALDRAINSGRVRLNSSCVQTSSSATTSSGNNTEASESDRETLRLIAQIAADGDKAINELNACIAAYNQVREAVNGQR